MTRIARLLIGGGLVLAAITAATLGAQARELKQQRYSRPVEYGLFSYRQFTGVKLGCMGECPVAPKGCIRVSIAAGACGNAKCTAPAPQCTYQTLAGAPCGTFAGRCIPP